MAARLIAAWRPERGHPLTGPRELARTLESVVKSDPASWAATPLRTGGLLREPIYLSHYMRGIAGAESLDGVPIGELVDLIVLTSTHPWQPTAMGDPTYDYDPDWREAESAALDLIITLARKDLGFAGRKEEIWVFLDHQARARDQATPVPDMRPPHPGDQPALYPRPAGQCLTSWAMSTEPREQYAPTALDLLAETLALGGPDGTQHRAIIAPRLAFLRHVAPHWVDRPPRPTVRGRTHRTTSDRRPSTSPSPGDAPTPGCLSISVTRCATPCGAPQTTPWTTSWWPCSGKSPDTAWTKL